MSLGKTTRTSLDTLYVGVRSWKVSSPVTFAIHSQVTDCKTEHHQVEEEQFFPELEARTGVKGLMESNVEQHRKSIPSAGEIGELLGLTSTRRISPRTWGIQILPTLPLRQISYLLWWTPQFAYWHIRPYAPCASHRWNSLLAVALTLRLQGSCCFDLERHRAKIWIGSAQNRCRYVFLVQYWQRFWRRNVAQLAASSRSHQMAVGENTWVLE